MIRITRFSKDTATPAHGGTILASSVIPEGYPTPFNNAYGYLSGEGTFMEAHKHPHSEIYIIFSGHGFIEIDGEKAPVNAGDVVCIPPDSLHSMICGNSGDFLWAAFWWENIDA